MLRSQIVSRKNRRYRYVSEECEENEAAEWIPIDDDFPSGDEAPLAHPNCRCALQMRMVRAEEPVAA